MSTARSAAGRVLSRRARGFTLVELMVALALGLLVVLALVTLLINTNRNNSELGRSSRMIENGRIAMRLLEADLLHAGLWGGYIPQFDDLTYTGVPGDVPTAIPDPCTAYSTANWTTTYQRNVMGLPVQVYSIPSTVASPPITGICTSSLPNIAASNDVLFVRYARPCPADASGCPAFSSGDLYFQLSRCTDSSSPNYSATTFVFGTSTTALSLRKRNCTDYADRLAYVSNLYYVRNYAATSGDGIPTLVRSQYGLSSGAVNHKAADALVENIDGFRVILGVDSKGDTGEDVDFTKPIEWADATNLVSPKYRGDGNPDGDFVRCSSGTPCTVSQLMNSVAVRVYILVRAESPTPGYTDTKTYNMGIVSKGPFNDAYKRHLFTQTVRMVNVSSRRETP